MTVREGLGGDDQGLCCEVLGMSMRECVKTTIASLMADSGQGNVAAAARHARHVKRHE